MRIARHEHVLVLVALLYEFIEQHLHGIGYLHQLVTRKQLQVHQHLVIARTSRVYLLAHVAKLAGKQHLHLRVYVLHAVLDGKLAPFAQFVDALQLAQQHWQLVLADESYAFEHGDVGHRAQHVVLGEIEVHLAVTSYGEPLNLLVHLKVLLPEFHVIRI